MSTTTSSLWHLEPLPPAWLLTTPGKIVYWLFAVLEALVKAPYWIVTSALPWTRARKSFDFSRQMVVYVAKHFAPRMLASATIPNQALDPSTVDPEKGLVWVEPTPDLVVGEIKEAAGINGVEAVRVIGYMQYRDGEARRADERAIPGEKIIYYFLGGGYFMGDPSAKGKDALFTKRWLNQDSKFSRAFHLEYRKAQAYPLPAKNNFPAALLDAVAGYNYLVNVLGFEPRNILLAGQSSGSHLGINLIRYLLLNNFPTLPVPGSFFVLSPALDWDGSFIGSPMWHKNRDTDFVQKFYYGYPTRCQLGALPKDMAKHSPWISPVSPNLPDPKGLFKGFPPTFYVAGGAECTLDAMRALNEKMKEDMGDDLEYIEVKDALHSFMIMEFHEPEVSETLKKMVEWTDRVYPEK